MKAEILKVTTQATKDGTAHFVCFKGEDGKSYRSWIMEKYRNFKKWQGLLKVGVVLDNLVVKGAVVDADSSPKLVQ